MHFLLCKKQTSQKRVIISRYGCVGKIYDNLKIILPYFACNSKKNCIFIAFFKRYCLKIFLMNYQVTKKSIIAINKNIKFNFIMFLLCALFSLNDTEANDNIPNDSNNTKQSIDSLNNPDSIVKKHISPSGIDTTVKFYAADTVIVKLSSKMMFLKGNAQIEMKNQKLTAAIIEVDFGNSTLKAKFIRDSNGQAVGIPCMVDNGEEFFGEELFYNMKTSTGTIKSGETKMGEGFYYGSVIKRISEREFYVKDGYYTTCDAPHPHYHFASSEMKILFGEKLFADPLYFYVEDIPIFAIPFAMFMPMTRGRNSGFIVPSFYFSSNRGVVFQDFGFYWAASDYWDTKLTTDIYSKGGFLFKNNSRWVLKDIHSGSINLNFGNTRLNLEDEFRQEWKIGLQHSHIISPFENVNVNINLSSPDFNRTTSTDINARVKQDIYSAASYSKTFENGVNSSISLQNGQNIVTNEYEGTVPFSIYLPQRQFIRKLFNIPQSKWYSWIRDIGISYRGSSSFNFQKKIALDTVIIDDGDNNENYIDTVFRYNSNGIITHSPSLLIAPKLGYFNITPTVNFGANHFFRKVIKSYNDDDSTVSQEFRRGFFTEYYYSLGIGVSTRLYGIADEKRKFFGIINPNTFGIKAFRHTYQPSMNFNYSPDFSSEIYGFYGRYYDARQGREIIYSHYEQEGGSRPSTSLQKRLSYSDVHSFEIKKQGKDTLPDENIELLRLTLGLSYNFAADSLNLSDLSTSFRTPALKILDFTGNANFTFYDETKVFNANNEFTHYSRVNQYLISNGKGLARLTDIRFNIGTSFSSTGIGTANNFEQSQNLDSVDLKEDIESAILGNRFLRRDKHINKDGDIWGENTFGYSPFSIPWSISLNLEFSYNNRTIDRINRTLNLRTSFNFTIAENWKITSNFQYDILSKRFITPDINLTKDLHCWDLTASWYPTGYNQGFYLRFGIKASQLRDLKIEKRDSPVFR